MVAGKDVSGDFGRVIGSAEHGEVEIVPGGYGLEGFPSTFGKC